MRNDRVTNRVGLQPIYGEPGDKKVVFLRGLRLKKTK